MGGVVTAPSSLSALDSASDAESRGTAATISALKLKGEEEAKSYEFESEQYEIQAQTLRTAADQAETNRRDALISNIETIQAIAVGRGVGMSGGTVSAIIANLREDTESDITTERVNYMTKIEQAVLLSERATEKAAYSLLAAEYAVEAETAGHEARQATLESKKIGVVAGAFDSVLNFGTKMFGSGSS